jgi:Co/Zn/Cd efflux system component
MIHEHPASGEGERPASRSAARRQQAAARLSLCSNALLVLIKIGAGIASGSLSVLAEGVQSMMDVLASGLILLTVRAAAAPPIAPTPTAMGSSRTWRRSRRCS